MLYKAFDAKGNPCCAFSHPTSYDAQCCRNGCKLVKLVDPQRSDTDNFNYWLARCTCEIVRYDHGDGKFYLHEKGEVAMIKIFNEALKTLSCYQFAIFLYHLKNKYKLSNRFINELLGEEGCHLPSHLKYP